jgi:hypothetical protein
MCCRRIKVGSGNFQGLRVGNVAARLCEKQMIISVSVRATLLYDSLSLSLSLSLYT